MKSAKQFYDSKQWKECRTSYIAKVFGLCERCGEPGYILHHKIWLTLENINDPNVTLNHDNLEYVCLDCHNKIHMGEHTGVRDDVMFDENGDLVESGRGL